MKKRLVPDSIDNKDVIAKPKLGKGIGHTRYFPDKYFRQMP